MANVTPGYTWASGNTVTAALLNQAVDDATVTNIVNADIDNNAAIALSKLATGALPTGITVASANLVNGTIVAEDIASGAVTAPKLQNGVTLQTVYAQTTTQTTITTGDEIPVDNTKPQNTEGKEILTATITPSSNTNKVLISGTINGAVPTVAGAYIVSLFKDSGADAICTTAHSFPANHAAQIDITFQDSPATTSAVTYKIRVGYVTGGGGLYINAGASGASVFGGTFLSWMTLSEIKA